jgi:hypothetical protein
MAAVQCSIAIWKNGLASFEAPLRGAPQDEEVDVFQVCCRYLLR